MRTVLNKIFFGAIFLYVSWLGLDGLTINLFHNSTKTLDIIELEKLGHVEARNLEITNGISYKEDFIYYESNSYSPVDIIYPLISHEQSEKYYNSEPIKIKLLIRLNSQNRSCLKTGNCIPKDSSSVMGFVKVGLENLRNYDFQSLEWELVSLDENVILLEPNNEEPIKWYWNLLMLLGGTIFGFTILKSFFRKASSLEEYWKKVTEKDES